MNEYAKLGEKHILTSLSFIKINALDFLDYGITNAKFYLVSFEFFSFFFSTRIIFYTGSFNQ